MAPGRAVEEAAPETTLPGVEAVVLVGGVSTWMRPLTLSAPKPVVGAGAVVLRGAHVSGSMLWFSANV